MKIYTKTGDTGTTSLVSGERVSKASLRLESYGTIDELTANIGYLHDILPVEKKFDDLREQLIEIISRTMDCAALMATADLGIIKLPRIENRHIEQLENWSDELLENLPILKKFTLPAGAPQISYAHICRTITRRAERAVIRVRENGEPIDNQVPIYLNRLSDYMYALSRKLTNILDKREIVWR